MLSSAALAYERTEMPNAARVVLLMVLGAKTSESCEDHDYMVKTNWNGCAGLLQAIAGTFTCDNAPSPQLLNGPYQGYSVRQACCTSCSPSPPPSPSTPPLPCADYEYMLEPFYAGGYATHASDEIVMDTALGGPVVPN